MRDLTLVKLLKLNFVQHKIDMLDEADQMAQRLYLAELHTFVGLHKISNAKYIYIFMVSGLEAL